MKSFASTSKSPLLLAGAMAGAMALLSLCLCACNADSGWDNDDPNRDQNTPASSISGSDSIAQTPTIPDDAGNADDGEFVPNSQQVSYANMVSIVFASSGTIVVNPFADAGVSVVANGGHVVVNSNVADKEIAYVLSGATSNGSLKIYGSYKLVVALNGVSVENPTGAALNIQCKKKITLTLVNRTSNRLYDGAAYAFTSGEDMKAALFSEGQLVVSGGSGTLEVRGKNKHGIATDDFFTLTEGNIVVKEAVSDGIHANDEVLLSGGSISIRSAGEGVESEGSTLDITGGSINIVTTGTSAHALKSLAAMTVSGAPVVEAITYGNGSKGLKSGGDLSIGGGSLTLMTTGDAFYDASDADVSSPSGIKCDGNMLVSGGSLTIVCEGKAGKGISVDGELTIDNGNLIISTTGGTFTYNRDASYAKAIKAEGNLTVNGGSIEIRTTGTGAEGMESKSTLTVNGGVIEIVAVDDAINAAKHIQINGGWIFCATTSNDAIDSNGTLTIAGGTVVIAGNEDGFDCDNNRFAITGGTLVGVGSGSSTPTASACTQRAVLFGSTSTGVSVVRIEATSDGKEALTFQLPRTYSQRMTLLFSSSALEANASYTIYTGGSIANGTNFHGLYSGASYTKGTSAGTFTASTMVSTVGNVSGGMGGGPGGNPGGNPGGRP